MNSILIAGVVFACAFGGAVVGMVLQRVLPELHLRHDSKEVVRLGTGLIATMAALVLGLLIGGAKTAFDTQRSGFQLLATNVIMLDQSLARFGPDAKPAREQLRGSVATMIDRLWPNDGSQSAGMDDPSITANGGALYNMIRELAPTDEGQRSLQAQAFQVGGELARTRWQLSQADDGSLPIPFLVVLAFWLFVLFTSFGLFSPRNATVIVVLLVCALSVAGAVLLIVDLDQPFEGLIQVSSVPLRNALEQIGR